MGVGELQENIIPTSRKVKIFFTTLDFQDLTFIYGSNTKGVNYLIYYKYLKITQIIVLF